MEEAVNKMPLDHLGYIIEPDNLFDSLVAKIKGGKFSIEDYEKAIALLVGSTVGYKSEAVFDKLFDDMNLSARLSTRYDIDFNFEDAEFDVLGTAYMILIGLFASDAGKKGRAAVLLPHGVLFSVNKVNARLKLLGL